MDTIHTNVDHLSEKEQEFVLRATVHLGILYLRDTVEDKGKAWMKNQLADWLAKELPKLRK